MTRIEAGHSGRNSGEISKIGQDSIKSISIYYIFWIEIKYTGYSRWNEIELRTLPRTEHVKKYIYLSEGQVVFQHSCQAIQVEVNWILKSMIMALALLDNIIYYIKQIPIINKNLKRNLITNNKIIISFSWILDRWLVLYHGSS